MNFFPRGVPPQRVFPQRGPTGRGFPQRRPTGRAFRRDPTERLSPEGSLRESIGNARGGNSQMPNTPELSVPGTEGHLRTRGAHRR